MNRRRIVPTTPSNRMKSLLLIPLALGTLLLASCAGTMAANCDKCCKSASKMCCKTSGKCTSGCTTCKH